MCGGEIVSEGEGVMRVQVREQVGEGGGAWRGELSEDAGEGLVAFAEVFVGCGGDVG